MTTRIPGLAALALLGCAPLADLGAQSLAQRVESAPDGDVRFSYAAREGVCGNGRSFVSIGGSTFIGSYNSSTAQETCAQGPVRVELGRSGRVIVDIDTYVGPPPATASIGGTDLGTVSAAAAAEYLLTLAARLDGRPSKDAIMPAMLADSANAWPHLLAIARDRDRPRETRRSAISWMARASGAPGRTPGATVAAALAALAADRNDNLSVRDRAVSSLARLEDGSGIPALVEMARSRDDLWLAKEAASSLSRSGDPRARQFLRAVAQQPSVHEDVVAIAIKGLGGSYATTEDADLLRGLYPRLTREPAKERVISAVAAIGGGENVRWLMALAGNADEPVELRREALEAAAKAQVPTAELVAAYDRANDRSLKYELIDIYAKRPEAAALDKLVSIARSDEDPRVRRRAVQRLSRSTDPRAARALQEIATQ